MALAAVLQAGRGRLAVGWYHCAEERWQFTGKLEVMDVQALAQAIKKPTLVCGELQEAARHILGRKYKNVLLASPANSLRRPAILAELAWQRWASGQVDDPVTLSPLYLHYGEPIPG
jgi:tRNA threonylcarbamoyladenosine biosynthesis protein TsaB